MPEPHNLDHLASSVLKEIKHAEARRVALRQKSFQRYPE